MIARAAATLARLTPVPLLVRLGAFAAGLTALLLATPAPLRTAPVVVTVLVLLPVLSALAPAGPWPTLTLLATATAWVAATELYDAVPVTIPGVLLLAALLYLHHTLTALAASLPYDAAVDPDVVGRWLSRAAAVLAVSGLLAAAVLATLAALPAGGVSGVATLAGLAVALLLILRRS